MVYTNAQILAAVVSHWARPAVIQVATARLSQLPILQSLQASVVGSGVVNGAYNIANDIQPLMAPLVNNLLTPYLEKQFSQVPDAALPLLARDILAEAERLGSYSIMDGFLTLDKSDIAELKQLVDKNLPLAERDSYIVIT